MLTSLEKKAKSQGMEMRRDMVVRHERIGRGGGGRAFFSLSASKEPYITIIWYVVRRYFTLNDREVISQYYSTSK